MLKRTLADMENLRHRTSRQAEQSQKFAIQVHIVCHPPPNAAFDLLNQLITYN